MSQGNPYGANDVQPQYQRPSGNNNGVIIGVVVAVVMIGVLMCGGIMVGLLLPAVQADREAARRMQCSNNTKQIQLALLNYESANGSFPPAYTVDAAGNKLHSWRTLILPYLEQKPLYDQLDLSKPWDDPANRKYADVSLAVYTCPSTPIAPGMTTYQAVVDPAGIFSGSTPTTFKEISDGSSNTLLITETDINKAVNWVSPLDSNATAFAAMANAQTAHTGGCNCGMADGSVQFFSKNLDPQTRQALITKDGGEDISLGY